MHPYVHFLLQFAKS
uniref:Uncharacterized protein n=1 Tax=Rhizophora mucronata TaxID=61149 RepID=A0A2P2NIN4_RHIMU